MIKKASVIISLLLCGLCLTLFVWVKQSPGENVEKPKHQPEELNVSRLVDEEVIRSKPIKEQVLLETDSGSVEPPVEVENSPVLARMPAGYQPDQLRLLQKHSGRQMDSQSVKRAIDHITGVVKASNSERFRALADLYEAELPDSEATRLLDYLKDPNRYKGMSDAAMFVLINELVAVFHDQPVLADDYLEVSAQVINDKSHHEVVRDYTLQGLSRGIGNASGDQAEAIKQIFWDCLDETDTSLAGTALLALNREYRMDNLSDDAVARLGDVVAAFLEDMDVGERTRIPAMQVADDMELAGLNDNLARISSEPNTFSERIVIKSIRVK